MLTVKRLIADIDAGKNDIPVWTVVLIGFGLALFLLIKDWLYSAWFAAQGGIIAGGLLDKWLTRRTAKRIRSMLDKHPL